MTPLSRLQHDLSLAPGIPDSYRLFGEGPTVSTYGDLREVVGGVEAPDRVPVQDVTELVERRQAFKRALIDAQGYRPDEIDARGGLDKLFRDQVSMGDHALDRSILAAISAVPSSQGMETS